MKIYIIPDVHGRSFWRKILDVKFDPDDRVVFLGDYSDPYSHEGIFHKDALIQLSDIVQFKKDNSHVVKLLLGNHDLSYMYDFFPKCRFGFSEEYKKFFVKQSELFQIAFQWEQYLFTHAGVLKGWVEDNEDYKTIFPFNLTLKNISENTLTTEFKEYPEVFSQVSRNRGGDFRYGSPVWADRLEVSLQKPEIEGLYQIFGHSQQAEKPIITDHYACLDCRKIFVLENNIITEV